MGRVGRAVGPVVVLVLVVGFLFAAVFPTRTYLAQRAATRDANERIEVLREESAALEERVAELQSDEEIERLAREHYGLVRPGEEAYAILPPSAPPPAGDEEPAGPDDDEPGLLARAWDGLRDLW